LGAYKSILAQLGEASLVDAIKVRLFSLPLTRIAFSWFASLAPGSISSWYDLEKKFHEHFFSGTNELKLSLLTSVKQQCDESVVDYIKIFSETKNRCFNVFIAKKDLADLALNGLHSYLKEKLEGFEFFSINQVFNELWPLKTQAKNLENIINNIILICMP
jgi:hypothetical protein